MLGSANSVKIDRYKRLFFFVVSLGCIGLGSVVGQGASLRSAQNSAPALAGFVDHYCADCHDPDSKKGDLDLVTLCRNPVQTQSEGWEKVVRQLRARQMPPSDKKRPSEREYNAVLDRLEGELDSFYVRRPDPGRTESLRRLNRTEYQNAIRDLLALDVDAASLLPKDDAGHGFDNVTVSTLSPTLLDRYLSAAQKISRLAVGSVQRVGGDTFRPAPDLTQESHVDGLPFGTRGGMCIPYTFPQDAEYEVQVRLTRDRNDEVEGLRERHQMDVLLDGERCASFSIEPPKDRNFDAVDRHLKARIRVKAGPHRVGVTFVKQSGSLIETLREPYHVHFNMHRHPRLGPAVYQVSINGPYEAEGPGTSPSRQRIFIVRPSKPEQEESCAKQIFLALARRAYRRPVTDEDIEKPLSFFHAARQESGFDGGIEAGLAAILVSPNFLLRIEKDPENVAGQRAYRISDLELASRLSFFLWSSLPDETLLTLAERGELHQSGVLEKQTRRMLADPRAKALASNFAGQWLYLRNLDSFTPDLRLFPDFDDNLRQALKQETELFFDSVVREDRSVLTLLKADYTFLNQRLAEHYGIPNVYGSRLRRVVVAGQGRGGLLRQGSVLAVTSYATRTSPVMRGKWILDNLMGTPPPPPPGNVPALKDNAIAANLSVRERLAEHRANPQCASCHKRIDPPGFALENFDAVGRWRRLEEGKAVDASGGLPDGSECMGVDALEQGLLQRPELFVGTLTEKLMTFALGRGVDAHDAPAIRTIVRDAKAHENKFSAVVIGITQSIPFTMRRSP